MSPSRLLVAALAGSALLTACSGGTGTGAGGAARAALSAPDVPASAGAGLKSAGTGATSDVALPIGNPQGRVERTVTAAFVVPHGGFASAMQTEVQRAVTLGGYVQQSQTHPDAQGTIASGEVTLRVPAAHLSDMVSGLPSGFQVSSIDYASVDHSAETVDLQAHLSALQDQAAALQRLLRGTTNLSDIVTITGQWAAVQEQIDRAEGSLAAVNDRVDMATATIALRERGLVVAPAPTGNRVGDGLRAGWSNAAAVAGWVALGAATALPVAVVVLVLLGLAWAVRRLRSRPPAPAPQP